MIRFLGNTSILSLSDKPEESKRPTSNNGSYVQSFLFPLQTQEEHNGRSELGTLEAPGDKDSKDEDSDDETQPLGRLRSLAEIFDVPAQETKMIQSATCCTEELALHVKDLRISMWEREELYSGPINLTLPKGKM